MVNITRKSLRSHSLIPLLLTLYKNLYPWEPLSLLGRVLLISKRVNMFSAIETRLNKGKEKRKKGKKLLRIKVIILML